MIDNEVLNEIGSQGEQIVVRITIGMFLKTRKKLHLAFILYVTAY